MELDGRDYWKSRAEQAEAECFRLKEEYDILCSESNSNDDELVYWKKLAEDLQRNYDFLFAEYIRRGSDLLTSAMRL